MRMNIAIAWFLLSTSTVGAQQRPGYLESSPPPSPQPPGHLEEKRTNIPTIIPSQSDAIVIVNRGNATLSLAYYDKSKWQTIRVSPARNTAITCGPCGDSITLNFHDGREAKNMNLPKGKVYQLSKQGDRWALLELPNPDGRPQ